MTYTIALKVWAIVTSLSLTGPTWMMNVNWNKKKYSPTPKWTISRSTSSELYVSKHDRMAYRVKLSHYIVTRNVCKIKFFLDALASLDLKLSVSESVINVFRICSKSSNTSDVMWCDVMWCEMMWCEMMWCEMMWCDVM